MKSKTRKTSKVKAKAKPKKFPGYPLYPASQDITSQGKRVPADLEDPSHPVLPGAGPSRSRGRKPGTAAGKFDVTKADLKALGPKDDNLDPADGEDDELKHRTTPVDFAGKDLDIPGDDEAPGESSLDDEENNSYSLGGDDHNDLEEDPS
jgi:hypothetical protein